MFNFLTHKDMGIDKKVSEPMENLGKEDGKNAFDNKLKKNNGSKNGADRAPVNIRVLVYCFIATFILYALIITVEKSIINSEEKLFVYVAVMDVPEALLITEENVDTYFTMEERSVSALPKGYITNKNELIGYLTNRVILKKEVAAGASFIKEAGLIAQIENPVEVSLNAGNLAQVVGGVLRTGDYINIWSVKAVSSNGIQSVEAVSIYKGAYVTRAFTSTGEEISRDNKEAATTVVNIVIPAEQEAEFNKAMAEGTLRLGRLYDNAWLGE